MHSSANFHVIPVQVVLIWSKLCEHPHGRVIHRSHCSQKPSLFSPVRVKSALQICSPTFFVWSFIMFFLRKFSLGANFLPYWCILVWIVHGTGAPCRDQWHTFSLDVSPFGVGQQLDQLVRHLAVPAEQKAQRVRKPVSGMSYVIILVVSNHIWCTFD